MRICERAANWFQVINAEGDVRACCWMRNNLVGNLVQDGWKEIMQGERAQMLRQSLIDGTFEYCNKDCCRFLANDDLERHLIDIDKIPDYPSTLYLAYEGVCNYSCPCCSSYQHMRETMEEDKSRKYDALEEKLKEILPHVRCIGANGRGELFASKRTLKLLSEWKPLAPPEEIFISLETNGSLFDEQHWKQIENLGQYHLSVFITVMSFNEPIYQHLSGTKLPVSRIEENLRFIKKLRKEGIINFLQLGALLQEANFREMPEYTERCLNEFGADQVRIRPIMSIPTGRQDENIQWFMDVRNPYHPYYEDYCRVMEHPVFRDPRVLLWSGNMPSTRGNHPGIKRAQIQNLTEKILYADDLVKSLAELAQVEELSEIVLYGVGTIGHLLIRLLKDKVKIDAAYDSYAPIDNWKGVPIKRLCEVADEKRIMFITAYGGKEIEEAIREAGYKGKIVNVYDLCF